MKLGDPMRRPDQMFQAQAYWQAGERDHTRQDGGQMKLVDWFSFCADCGAPFMFSTPAGPRFSPTRRCAEHRRAGARVAKNPRPDRFKCEPVEPEPEPAA